MDIKSTMPLYGFGHKECRHIIIDHEGELWLAMMPVAVGGFLTMGMSRLPGSLRFEPLENGELVPYDYTATEALLEVSTKNGAKYKLAIDSQTQAIRITGNASLRLNGVETASFATTLNAEEGVKISIGAVTYFIVAKQGTYTFDDTWERAKFHSVTPVYEVTPEDGQIELYVYDLPSDTPIPEITKTLEECAAENEAEFKAFVDSLVDVPEEWNDVKEKIAYPLWLGHRTFEDGRKVIVKSKYNSTVANARLMSIASMAFKDPVKALDMILSCPAEPIIGVAVKRLIDEGLLNDSRGEIYRAYEALEKLARYWINERTVDKDGLSFYAYRFESGQERSPEYFKVGEPVLAPDLNAYLIIVSEVLGKLANMEYDDGVGQKWAAHAEALLKRLVYELWNGDGFVGKNAYTGDLSDSDKKLSAVPLILGSRLPADIISMIPVDDVGDEEGLLVVAGLYDAGEREKAIAITTKALEALRSGMVESPFYGASLLALAHKVL